MTAALPDAATLDGLVARASDPKRERWLQQVRRTGGVGIRSGCAAPSVVMGSWCTRPRGSPMRR